MYATKITPVTLLKKIRHYQNIVLILCCIYKTVPGIKIIYDLQYNYQVAF